MTLITHFRNKKYAVVAADQKISCLLKKEYLDRRKILVSGDKKVIVAHSSQIIDDILDYKEFKSIDDLPVLIDFLKNERIKSSHLHSNILVVTSEKSILYSKRYPNENDCFWEIAVNSDPSFSMEKLKYENDLKQSLTEMAKSPVFFNEGSEEISRFISFQCFNGSFKTILNLLKGEKIKFDMDYTIHQDELEDFDIHQIREIIKRFYADIYKQENLSKTINGDVNLVILNLETKTVEYDQVISKTKISKCIEVEKRNQIKKTSTGEIFCRDLSEINDIVTKEQLRLKH